MPHSLTYEGLREGAIQAVKDGVTFDEYCEIIAKVIISGQSKDEVKGLLQGAGVHIYFQGLNVGGRYMIAQEAAQYYLGQPKTYSVTDVRQKFSGEILIVGGKPYIVFPDKTTLSIQKIVEAKFPEEKRDKR